VIITFFDIDFKLHADLKGNSHPRKIPNIYSFNGGIDHLCIPYTVNVPGIEVHRLPVLIYIFFSGLVQAVIAFILYKFSE